ncbi:MAG: VWA domain-containing protein [Actinobacteria bacterium]|nr:VWA domain-containing protein [Actinomycetota bacterium]
MAESINPTERDANAGGFAEEESLSEFWRVNVSHLEATELANLLRALRKVAGSLGRNVGDVIYAGMSMSPGAIVIDPEPILGRYPVNPRQVDRLVGVVVHEALHRTEWSDLVWRGVKHVRPDLSPRQKVVLSKIIQVGEDIYVDSVSERSILGLYTRKARRTAMRMMELGLRAGEVSVDKLLHLWWSWAWGQDISEADLICYGDALAVLQGITPELRAVMDSGKGVVERCDLRREIYIRALEGIRDTVASWKIVDKMVPWSLLSDEPLSEERAGGGGGTRLDPTTFMEIEAKMAESSGDLTSVIRSVVDDPEQEILPTRIWNFYMPALSVVDRHQATRLKTIMQCYADRKVLISRGLSSGKVDRKRLYRAPINGACFLDKQKIPDASWSICLLIDASGSMGRGNSWRLVESTVATLHEALRGSTTRLQVWAYYESHHVCVLTSLLRGDELMSVSPTGETPSGQALIAAAYMLPKDRKRKMIIHITDGASNAGCDVRYGIDYCDKQNIRLITLGCGLEDRQAMLEQYGRSVQFIDHISQLPSALEKLLKWAFVYGFRGKPGLPRGLEKVLNPD